MRQGSPRLLAARNRALSLLLAAGAVLAAHLVEADPARRARGLYALVALVGYGHLLGATRLLGAGRQPPHSGVASALAATGCISLFVLYDEALAAAPLLVLPLLAVSTWHTVENDLALAEVYRRQGRPAPWPRGLASHLLAVGVTALWVALFTSAGATRELAPLLHGTAFAEATAAPFRALAAALAVTLTALGAPAGAALAAGAALLPSELARRLDFADLFALAGLYHLASWGLVVVERLRVELAGGETRAARRRLRRVVAAHALPVAAILTLLGSPGGRGTALAALLLSPAVYLFASVLHVAQTAARRAAQAP